MPNHLKILTRHRDGAPFRQRIEAYLEPLRAHGVEPEVEALAPGAWGRRKQFRRALDADGILLHRKTLTRWDGWAVGPHWTRIPLIYDFDDALMFQSSEPDQLHRGRLRRFVRTMRHAELVLAGSPVLAEHASRLAAAWVEVVPTGLDVRRYPAKSSYATWSGLRLVWIGSRSTLKQLEALRPALEAVGKHVQGIHLRVIADEALEVPGLAVENVPWSLATEARLLAECDVGIAPLPDTPYTRGKCGFKVLQYMAAGLPVVASPVGVNADYVRPEETGLHAATAEAWVEGLRRLVGDVALRERLGRAGRRRVEREFDVSVLAPRVCGLIVKAMQA